MTSLFAFTLYVFPPDTNSTASATRGALPLPSSESVLGLNKILVASAPVSTTRFFLLAFGSKYPVREEDRVPDRGSTALAGVKKPVALPVSYRGTTTCKVQSECQQSLFPPSSNARTELTGLELVLAPSTFAAATDSSIRSG